MKKKEILLSKTRKFMNRKNNFLYLKRDQENLMDGLLFAYIMCLKPYLVVEALVVESSDVVDVVSYKSELS